MSIDMYLPALPALERYFSTDTASVQHTLASFFAGLAIGQLLYGPIADKYGRKPPLYFRLTLYVIASAACALAPGIGSLIVLRFLQAVSGCAGMVVARAMVRDLYDRQESARVFSILLMVMGIAPIVAPLAGGYLLTWFGWRSIFWVLALFGVACLVAVKWRLPETVPLFFVVSLRGLTFPNASAGAMAPFPEKAGSASALLGSVQFAISAVASAAVGVFHDGTAVPMAAVIGTCGLLAFVSYRLLVRKD